MATSANDKAEAAERKLREYLSRQRRYTDEDIDMVAAALEDTENPSWSKTPRLYILLRAVDKLQLMPALTLRGICDLWIPFSRDDLTDYPCLLETNILSIQMFLLTDDTTLDPARHRHLESEDRMPFKYEGELAPMNKGVIVEKVSSAGRVLARKMVHRRMSTSSNQWGNMANFKKELDAYKRVVHHHIVKFEGSYTTTTRAAHFMSPVADINLKEYFVKTEDAIGQDACDRRAILRSFFGCLAGALAYVHQRKIRHRDIKPANIVIHDSLVLLIDFGTSNDWSEKSRSKTKGEAYGVTFAYTAREVAEAKPRGRASDVFSLGCVFLEIATVIQGKKVEDLKAYLEEVGLTRQYWCSETGVAQWIQMLHEQGAENDGIPLTWIENMLRPVAEERWKALEVKGYILSRNDSSEPRSTFCGKCCDRADKTQAETTRVVKGDEGEVNTADVEVLERGVGESVNEIEIAIEQKCVNTEISVGAQDE